jgi:hypothetical protein
VCGLEQRIKALEEAFAKKS